MVAEHRQSTQTGCRRFPSVKTLFPIPILDRKSIIEDELPITGACTLMVIYFTIMATNVFRPY